MTEDLYSSIQEYVFAFEYADNRNSGMTIQQSIDGALISVIYAMDHVNQRYAIQ